MKWTGKIVGALIGIVLGSPILVLLGILVGHLFDAGIMSKWMGVSTEESGPRQQSQVQTIFFNSTFMIMGYLAKCDGRVSENEIRMAENVMQDMNLNLQMRREAIRLFNVGKQSNFNVDQVLHQLRTTCWSRPSLLRIFIEIQFKIAFADGNISEPKRRALEMICRQLGLTGFNFSQFEQRQRAEQNYQRYQQYSPNQNSAVYLEEAYRVLGISSQASDAEVKKAYRRLMSQHHPDKLMSKGLPPEMIKMATQKTQQIKKAYEQICAARNTKNNVS